jgi:hypothetical protein
LEVFGLISTNVCKIGFQPYQGRNVHRKNPIQNETQPFPVQLVGSYRKFGFRSEKMIKASLFHPGLLTDLVDTHRPITLPPDKFMRRLQETQLGITTPHSHKEHTGPIGQPQLSFFEANQWVFVC